MLIAEIGNNHFGKFDSAKELIRIAHESGADLIKSQAFKACDITSGSMPRSFYEACAFSLSQYIELIDYARSIGNDLFYSIFSDGFDLLRKKQIWHKITGAQSVAGMATIDIDFDSFIISTPSAHYIPVYRKASVLYVSEYLTENPNLSEIARLFDHVWRPIGYSDHCIGIQQCINAKKRFGANIIEKHFCLTNDVAFAGTIFRDTVHAVKPKEFSKLARIMTQ